MMTKSRHKLDAIIALGSLHSSLHIKYVQTNIVNFITKTNCSHNSLFRLPVDVFAVLLLSFFVFPMLTTVEIL